MTTGEKMIWRRHSQTVRGASVYQAPQHPLVLEQPEESRAMLSEMVAAVLKEDGSVGAGRPLPVEVLLGCLPNVRSFTARLNELEKNAVLAREHVDHFPVACNGYFGRDQTEFTLGARGFEAWMLKLRELVGLKP